MNGKTDAHKNYKWSIKLIVFVKLKIKGIAWKNSSILISYTKIY